MSLLQRLERDAATLGVALGPGDSARLVTLIDELERWNRTFNLTAIKTQGEMLTHHLLDSLAIHADLVGDRIADVGTGAGFPGIPLALVLPDTRFTLAESVQKKARFVESAVASLELSNVTVAARRVEELTRDAKVVDIVDSYRDKLAIPRFDLAIDWGWFFFLTKPIFLAIDWIYHYVGNFGVAILVFTVFVKLLFFPLAGLIFLAWSTLNWVLSLAGVFAVRDGDARKDALGAVSAAVSFCRARSGAVLAVTIWTGLAHLTVFVVATTVVSMPLGLAQIVPARVVLAAVILLTVAYFAVADWLYIARLAGYVCIAEMPEALLAPMAPARLPALPPPHTTIDRDEPILSDLPNLAVET